MAKSNKFGNNDKNILARLLRVKRFMEENPNKSFSRKQIIDNCALSNINADGIIMCLRELGFIKCE